MEALGLRAALLPLFGGSLLPSVALTHPVLQTTPELALPFERDISLGLTRQQGWLAESGSRAARSPRGFARKTWDQSNSSRQPL
jgi:hypothetical protein